MQRYAIIAAASLAALVVGLGPAGAQTGSSTTPNVSGSAPSGSVTISPNTDVSPSINTNTEPKTNQNTNIKDDQSPSASPKGTDDKVKQDDKVHGLDRADEAAGPHGQQGRDNARERGNRR
jgi:hypothetical protein